MKSTSYFTFGQSHVHLLSYPGGSIIRLDKDIVLKITDEDPRAVMERLFGQRWSFEYSEDNPPDFELYPRGLIELLPEAIITEVISPPAEELLPDGVVIGYYDDTIYLQTPSSRIWLSPAAIKALPAYIAKVAAFNEEYK